MFRTPKTLTMIAAAIGVPYTASETDIGREAMKFLNRSARSVSSPVENFLSSSDSLQYGDHTHRDVERIWDDSIDRYRYSTQPQIVATATSTGQLVSATSRAGESETAAPSTILGPSDYRSSLVGKPISDLREVLRFDISPQWVTERFSRVSTVLAEFLIQ